MDMMRDAAKQVDFNQKTSLHLSPTIVFTRCPRNNNWGGKKKAKFQFQRQQQALFFSFFGSGIPGSSEGGQSQINGIVRWERLYTMQRLIICVAVSRVWALVLSSEALVHAIPLLVPPGRLVSPACEVRANQKASLSPKIWLYIYISISKKH